MLCPQCQTENPAGAATCSLCSAALLAAGSTATGALPAQTVLQERYLIMRRIGQGGMGAVYQASDRRLGTATWAIKELSSSGLATEAERQAAREAFRREAELLAGLDHPHLPRVFDHFSQDGKEYLVMEFVPGKTLAQLMSEERPPWPLQRVLGLADDICEVLDYLHSQTPPIIFRDLKPSNVIRTPKGQIKLVDFGIARLFKAGQAHDTQAFGTVGYAAPEQYGRGQTDARTDIYALGVLLHQLLSNYDAALTPFNLPCLRELNPAVPEPLAALIATATCNDASQRFQSVAAMRAALKSLPLQTLAPTMPAVYQAPVPPPPTSQAGLTYQYGLPPTTPQGGLPYQYGLPPAPAATPPQGLSSQYVAQQPQGAYGPASQGLPYQYGLPPQPFAPTPQGGLPRQPSEQLYSVPLVQQQTTGLAGSSRSLGSAALISTLLGGLLMALFPPLEGVNGFGALLVLLGIGMGMVALVLSILALAAQGTLQTVRGRDHAKLGLSFSVMSLVLSCVILLAI